MTKQELLKSMCQDDEFKEHELVYRLVETPERLLSAQIWEPPQFMPGFEEMVSCRLMRDSGYRDLYCFPMVNGNAEAEEKAQSQAPDDRKRAVMADATVLSKHAIGLPIFDDND